MAGFGKMVGLARLKRRLAAMPVKARQKMRDALVASAEELVRSQKALAERNRHSGDTIDSIQFKTGDHDLQIKVFSDFFASRWEEFGTVKTPAIPFFFPPYRILRKKIKSRARSAVRAAVKEAASVG